MSTELMSLNFEDLISIPTDDLSEKIPPETAVHVTLYKSFQAGDVSNCDIYKTWATLLFQHYGPSKISENDLNELLNVFTQSVKKLINACEDENWNEKSKALVAFISYTLELFTWIHSVGTEFSLKEVTAFLCFGLTVVDSYLSGILNKKGFRRFLEKSLAVQTMILNILSTVGPLGETDGAIFNDLVSHLCSVGEKTPKLDIKTAVETWKTTIKLLSQNTALTESNSSANSTWLARPMEFLIQEIGRNVQTVYNENSLKEPIQQIEKYLKVTNFYLRLLQKVTTDFRHVAFPVCKEYVDNLVLVSSPPSSIVGSPVEKVVVEYVSKGFKELIQFAYKNHEFFELLLSKQSEDFEKNESLNEILLDAIELAIRRNEIEFFEGQIFGRVFEKCLNGSYIFLSTSQYNRFVEIFAALQTHFRPDQFERELIKSVLQDDIVLATTAIDVWCIVCRNSHHFERYSYFLFWRVINEHFLKFSNQLQALYVEVLLKNLYATLTVEEKEEIWLEFDACMLTNDRFLLTIGLDAIPNEAQRTKIIQHFIDELQRFLKECSRDMTIDNFYSIVKDITLLTPIAFKNDELNEILLQYLEISMKHKKFDLLTESILNFITSKLEFIKGSRILKILTDLSIEISRFKNYEIRFCSFGFLKSVAKNPRLKEHAVKMMKIFEKDELVYHFGCTTNNRLQKSNRKPNNALLRDIVKKRLLDAPEETHVCQDDEDMPAKKMKKDVDHVIESLEINVNKLQAIAKMEPLDLSKMQIIKQIVCKLESIDGLS